MICMAETELAYCSWVEKLLLSPEPEVDVGKLVQMKLVLYRKPK